MSRTAAASGFILLLIQVVQALDDWGVTYTPTAVCALEGSTVELNCSYTHPSQGTGETNTVKKSFWFTQVKYYEYVDLTTDSEYTGRVTSTCHEKRCTLRITDVRRSDSAVYKFRFETEQFDGRFTGTPGVTLSVRDLMVKRSQNSDSGKYLECFSGCSFPRSSYIWYKNGERIHGATSSSYSVSSNHNDSFSCALQGLETFPSRPVCADGSWCNRVVYTNRRICAHKGSSVEISCYYINYDMNYDKISRFWFSPGSDEKWESPSKVSDHIQVFEKWSGHSTLRITDLSDGDSAEYRFKFTSEHFEWRSSLPGTTLTVADLQVQVRWIRAGETGLGPHTVAELRCLSSCSPPGRLLYVWFRNGQKLYREEASFIDRVYLGDEISCAFKGHERFPSPSVYAPKPPSVSVSPPGEIVEGSSVTLTCSSDSNPVANYTWYKKYKMNKNPDFQFSSKEAQLVLRPIQSSDSGEYYCNAENELGKRTSVHHTIIVKYAPRLLSVSVRPSVEILEGSSVTLTCSSDANPPARHTWYKKIHGPPLRQQGIYAIASITPEDGGSYFCVSVNQYGRINSSVFIDVHYRPRNTTVSVYHSDPMMEGSSVNMTCSGDANPAANYTWYKKNEPTPKGSGPVLTISDVRVEHSGDYYCEARNGIGHQNSTSCSVTVLRSMKSVAAGSIFAIFLVIILFSVILFIWKRKSSKDTSQPAGGPNNIRQVNVSSQSPSAEEQEDLSYASVHYSNHRDEAVYSNISPAPKLNKAKRKEEEDEDDVDYSVINFKSNAPTPHHRSKTQGEDSDSSAVYSTVMKTRRV